MKEMHARPKRTFAVTVGVIRRMRAVCVAAVLVSCVEGREDATTRPATPPALAFDHGGIVRGDVNRRTLSLVFTGGDYAEGVPTILAMCGARHVPGSFFVTGDFLRKHPDAARSIIAAGQNLGPHSDGHLLYCDWSDRTQTLVSEQAFKDDLRKNVADLAAIGGGRPGFFLPPFEWYNDDQARWSRDVGLTLINFTPGSGSNRDYLPESEPNFQPSTTISDDVLRYERRDPHGLNGFILLFHAGSLRADKMHDHLDSLVSELQTRGYRFVSLSELLTTHP